MPNNTFEMVYFLGIGGIGMSALARYFLAHGSRVYGYDKTSTPLTQQLEQEGAVIHYLEDVNQIPDQIKSPSSKVLVVYTPAIPEDNLEFQFFRKQNITLHKRSQVLGIITQHYFTIAIAGTHGKTTTSSMVAHLLDKADIPTVAFLGGISTNFNSNLLLQEGANVAVVEADEYDRSFLTLHPNVALITSLDADHMDVYGDTAAVLASYQDFVKNIQKGGTLITKPAYLEHLQVNPDIHYLTYSMDEQADVKAENVSIRDGNYVVNINKQGEFLENVLLGLPGIHNVENALGALAIAAQMKVQNEQMTTAMQSYQGVKRRFEYHIKTDNLVYIDDYAHHPTELEVCIRSVRQLFPSHHILGIFQPHLFSRTRDFAVEFAESLSLLDELLMLDIYPARELPIPGITAHTILDMVSIDRKKVVSKSYVIEDLAVGDHTVVLTLGAGDIDKLVEGLKIKWTKKAVQS